MHVELTVTCLIFTCCLAADDILKTAEGATENDAALVMYSLTFNGLWTKERFPKMFPLERPKAKWSAMLGRTHSASYKLFSIGDYASPALQMLFENSKTELLAAESQGHKGVFDTFSTSSMDSGNSSTTVHFFADSEHPLVSLVVRIDPSPDWFVGVDSLSLMNKQKGGWAPNVEIGLSPLDGGTQQGYTFTSPRWPTELRETVQEITHLRPNRTADAFYYPHLHRLPPIAWVSFKRMRTYGSQGETSQAAGALPLQQPPAARSYGDDGSRMPRPMLEGRRHSHVASSKSKAIAVAADSQNGTTGAASTVPIRPTTVVVPAVAATAAGRRQVAGRTHSTSVAPLPTFLTSTRPDDEQVIARADDAPLLSVERHPATAWPKTIAMAEAPVAASIVNLGTGDPAKEVTNATPTPLQRLAVAESADGYGGGEGDTPLATTRVVQTDGVDSNRQRLEISHHHTATPGKSEDVRSVSAVAADRPSLTTTASELEFGQPTPGRVEKITQLPLPVNPTANDGDHVGGSPADREYSSATGAAYPSTLAFKESGAPVGSQTTNGDEGIADDRDGGIDDDEDDGQEGSGSKDSAWVQSRMTPTTRAAAKRRSSARPASVPFLNRAGPSAADVGRRGAQRLNEFPSLLGLRGQRTSSAKPVAAAAVAADNITHAGSVRTQPLTALRVPTSQALEKASRFHRPPTNTSVREVPLVKLRGEPLRVTRQDSGMMSVSPTHGPSTIISDEDAAIEGARGECAGPRAWTEWTECSRACGSGLKERTRMIRPADGSAGCRLIRDQAVCRNGRPCTAEHFLFVDKLTAGAA